MDIHAKLVQLYCKYPTQAIEEADGKLLLDTFGVVRPEALIAIPGYPEAFAAVSECALIVDQISAKHPSPEDQVRESVRMLRRMVDDGTLATKVEGVRALIEGRMLKVWTPEQRELYEDKKQILEWRDFFVSYTNRDAPAINQQFQTLIKSCLGFVPKGPQLQTNHLARVITRHLRRYQQLSGFYDDDNLQVGENIQHKVDEYCTKVFAFVQLIEPLTFDKEPPHNWCFYEYRRFTENSAIAALLGDKDRHYFILTDSLSAITPVNLYVPFSGWAERMGNLKQVHINLHGERNTTLRDKVKSVAKQILVLRAEIIEQWLR